MLNIGAIIVSLLVLRNAEPATPKRLGFTVPKAPWMMGVPADTFEVTQQRLKPDGTAGYFMLTKGMGGLTVSMFIEPAKDCSSAVACREWAWKAEQTRLKDIQNVQKSEIGDATVIEYFQPTVGKLKIDQQNMHAYFVKDGYWIDFHLSQVAYKPADRSRFVDFIEGVQFGPKN
jgi:hypothetical protein